MLDERPGLVEVHIFVEIVVAGQRVHVQQVLRTLIVGLPAQAQFVVHPPVGADREAEAGQARVPFRSRVGGRIGDVEELPVIEQVVAAQPDADIRVCPVDQLVVDTAGIEFRVVHRTLDEVDDTVTRGRARARCAGTRDRRADRRVDAHFADALVGRDLRAHRRDDVLDLDLVVIEDHGDLRQEPRCRHERDRVRVRGLRQQELVTRVLAGDAAGVGDHRARWDADLDAVLLAVRPHRRIRQTGDDGRTARVDEAVGKGLGRRPEVLAEGRHADRLTPRRAQGQILDRTPHQVEVIGVGLADGRVIRGAERRAYLERLREEGVLQQRQSQLTEVLAGVVLGLREIRARVQEQEAVTGVARAADALGLLLTVLRACGEADRTGSPEVPEVAGDEGERVLLLVLLAHRNAGTEEIERRLAVPALAEDASRRAVGDLGVGGVVGATTILVRDCDAVGGQQLHAADDLARLAVDFAEGVDDRVRRMLEADDIDSALIVDVLEPAVGVAEFVVDVTDEPERLGLTTQTDHIAAELLFIELGAGRAEDAQTRARVGDGAGLDARRADDRTDVVQDRRAHRRVEVGVVEAGVEGRRRDQQRVRVDRLVNDADVEEGLLRLIEGLFLDVLKLGEELQVVGEIEVRTGLEPIGFGLRQSAGLTELGADVQAITADVQVADPTDGVADGAEVGEPTHTRGVELVGATGLSEDAVGADAPGGAERAGLRGDVAVRIGRDVVGEDQRAAARTGDVAQAADEEVVDDAVVGGAGRIEIATQITPGLGTPIDVGVPDFLVLFALVGTVDIHAIADEAGAAEDGHAVVGLPVLVDHRRDSVDFQPGEIASQHEIDHARDGVCAVLRGIGAGDKFDPLDEQARDGVDVDRQGADIGADMAATIDQRQGAAGAEVAQVEQRQTAVVEAGAGGVFRHDGSGQRGDIREHVDDATQTGLEDVFARDLDERRR